MGSFKALRPALDALVSATRADPCLSAEARRILHAVTHTGPEGALAVAEPTTRASTSTSRIRPASGEPETQDHLARLTELAPHLGAALPATAPPGVPDIPRSSTAATGDLRHFPGAPDPKYGDDQAVS